MPGSTPVATTERVCLVIKSHGGADSVAFAHAMDVAIVESQQRLPARIGEDIARELGTDAAVGTA